MKKTALSTLAIISLTQIATAVAWNQNCPQDSYFDGQTCICTDGLAMVKGYCVVPQCGTNQQWNGKTCDCIEGFTKLDGVNCRRCQINSHYNRDTNRCECDFGYTVKGNVCALDDNYKAAPTQGYTTKPKTTTSQYPQPSTPQYNPPKPTVSQYSPPPQYEYEQEEDYPQQQEYGYQEVANYEPQCGQNQIFDGQYCVCKKGYILFNDECTACPQGSNYDCTTKTCKCDQYSYYDANVNECAGCGKNEFYSNYRQECKCLKGYKRYDGVNCRICPLNSKYDKTIKKCRCNEGRYWNKNKCSIAY